MLILVKVGLSDEPNVMMAAMIPPGVTNQLALFYPDGQPILLNVQATPISGPEPGNGLRDGRAYADIEQTWGWTPMDHTPTRRSLWQIIADISTHGTMHPDHGFNCACLDQYAREIKQHVNRGLPPMYDEGADMYRSPEWAGRFDAQRRVAHVFRTVVDSL